MMRMRKLALGTAAIVAAALPVVGASSAQAASYNGACGSSYGVIDAASLPGYGTVYLTSSSAAGKNCVVTIRDNPGTRLPMNAYIRLSGTSTWHQNPGNFTTYAGPVYVSAAHQCIDWGGSINGVGFTEYNSHCN
jgi:hypothetical protein